MLNPGSAADAWPSDTLITMLLVVPTWVEPGVPLRRPLAASKLAHAGLFDTLKLKLSPSASLVEGVNAYDCPAVTCVAGDPEITGVAFGAGATSTAKGASDAKLVPSVALMTMLS